VTGPVRHPSSDSRDATPSPGSRRRCLVTGGAGFIGSHLTRLLLARGDHVTIIDDLSTGRESNLPTLAEAQGRVAFLRGRVGPQINALRAAHFDEVYHLAAAVGVRLVVQEPIRCIETNVEETGSLLRFVLETATDAGPSRVFLASSSEVYGKPDKAVFHEDDDVLYGPTTVGRWSYAMTKALDEHLGLAYHTKHAVPVVIARFFNTVGPRQVGDYGMVLPRFVRAALAGDTIEVHGDGRQSRCFCDVRDVVAALPPLLANPACHGRVFNVGSDQPISILELAKRVVHTLSSRSEIRLVPYTQAFGSGFEDLRARAPDLTRVNAAIGYQPRIGLEQTIRDVAASMGNST